MVLTPSTMVRLGSPAPEFDLKDVVTGRTLCLHSAGLKKAYLVMFLCRHCPYVQHIKDELTRLDRDYRDTPLCMIGISSNDAASYPDDAPESLAEFVKKQGWQFPFLYDETQEVAKRFTAACTPDLFLYDGALKLAYRGQLDDSRPGNGKPVTGKDLRAAIEALLSGRPVPKEQKPSIGCNIKWKKGNEPEYFG
jgi:peroxiredoxin